MSKKFERNVIKFLELLHYAEEPGGTGKFKKKYFKRESEYTHLIEYLERNNLIINGKYKRVNIFQLTDKGIEFLLERKKEKRQEQFNRIIAFTGAILALIGIYTFIKELELINNSNFWISYIFLFFVIASLGPIIKFIWDSYFVRD
ncbi:MAG: hypothetical protein WC584_02120 [Candidatus Pacearchaeota archaeon]